MDAATGATRIASDVSDLSLVVVVRSSFADDGGGGGEETRGVSKHRRHRRGAGLHERRALGTSPPPSRVSVRPSETRLPNASPRVSTLREDDSDSTSSSPSARSASPSKIAYIASPSSPRVVTTPLPGGRLHARAPSRSITRNRVRSRREHVQRDTTSSATRDSCPER